MSAAVGLYFGVLSGESSTQVPAITNGSFAPVIVAGLGVRLGLGKSLSIGPLDAGFFAGIVGVLEGVLAWFHPHDPAIGTQTYFKVRGTVGIQIHIWGRVDFSILQASLDILAYATASVAIESYQPIEVGFSAGVSVELSVKVLFFHITLRFSATISESFTIGQRARRPGSWTPAHPGRSGRPAPRSVRALMLASGSRCAPGPPSPACSTSGRLARPARAGLPGRATAANPDAVRPSDGHRRPAGRPPRREGGGSAAAAPRDVALPRRPRPARGRPRPREPRHPADPGPHPHAAGQDHAPDRGRRHVRHARRRARRSGPAPDADVFAVAWVNRAENRLLAGSATEPLTVRAPEGFVPADGVGVIVRDDQQSLADLAAAFLSPFEQLAREALLWAVESVTAGLQADGHYRARTTS